MKRFWSFDFFETFICFNEYLEQRPYCEMMNDDDDDDEQILGL